MSQTGGGRLREWDKGGLQPSRHWGQAALGWDGQQICVECSKRCPKREDISAAWSTPALPYAWNGLLVPIEWRRLGLPGSEVENPSPPRSRGGLFHSWDSLGGRAQGQELTRSVATPQRDPGKAGRGYAAGSCTLSGPRSPSLPAENFFVSAVGRLLGSRRDSSSSQPVTGEGKDGHFSCRTCLRRRAASYKLWEALSTPGRGAHPGV